MARKIAHVLHDILEAIDRIEEITAGRTLAEFERSWQMCWLVQRAIEIISEASCGIPDELKSTRPEIPWPRVRDIGNILRHQYEGISDPVLWNVVIDELPRLKAAVTAIAAALKD